MREVLESGGLRESLTSSDGCNPAQAPISNFASTQTACVGKMVSFENTSQNGSNSWSWVFESAGTSTLENPTVSWNNAGIYDVSLTASNNVGIGNTETKTDYITILQNTPNTYCANSTINPGNYGTGIDSVYLNTIVHSHTDNSNNHYQNFICSENTTLSANTNYSFRIKLNGGNLEFCNIYIDYNGNGIFEESEKIYSSNSQAITHIGSFTVPNNVITDTLVGFRVISDFNTISNNSCNDITYGEVEDYGIVFSSPPCINTSSITSQTACNSYTWNGTTYSSSGTYNYTTTNSKGCDSIAILHLTINNSFYYTDVKEQLDSFIWINNIKYYNSTSDSITFVNQYGCDSIIYLDLTIINTEVSYTTFVACDSYTWNENTYYNSGSYSYQTTNNSGGDSTAYLFLSIIESSLQEFDSISCTPIIWNNLFCFNSGEYTFSTQSSNGCDSTLIMNLTILENNNTSKNSCEPYLWNGTVYDSSGVYYLNSVCGADSLFLTIGNKETIVDQQIHCDNYEWINGVNYTESNNSDSIVYTSSLGCDSIIKLDLTILASSSSSQTVFNCSDYLWNGTVYNQSGLYEYQTANSLGCDSTAKLTLTIEELESGIITGSIQSQQETSENYSVAFNQGSNYQWIISSNGTIINGQGTNEIEVLWNNKGNGEICVVEQTTNQCKLDTSCIEINISDPVNVIENKSNNITIYPNPMESESKISFSNSNQYNYMKIYDVRGRELRKYFMHSKVYY